MNRLYIASFLGPNTIPAMKAVAGYLSSRLNMPVDFVNNDSSEEKNRLFDQGEIQLAWMCGLQYAWKMDGNPSNLELLAAPVIPGQRYQDRPIYYSDIIVREDSPFFSFSDLRNSTWAYNERHSYSGYYVVCYHLISRGEASPYFGRLLESGTHQDSLRLVLDGHVQMVAIDSTILDYKLACEPGLAGKIRVIKSLGPYPVPPWTVSQRLPASLRQQIRQLLLEMDTDRFGQDALSGRVLARFVPANDTDYDPIRQIARVVDKEQDSAPI